MGPERLQVSGPQNTSRCNWRGCRGGCRGGRNSTAGGSGLWHCPPAVLPRNACTHWPPSGMPVTNILTNTDFNLPRQVCNDFKESILVHFHGKMTVWDPPGSVLVYSHPLCSNKQCKCAEPQRWDLLACSHLPHCRCCPQLLGKGLGSCIKPF